MKTKIVNIIIIVILFGLYSCSSISQSQRYGNKKAEESSKSKTVRFTSDESSNEETKTTYKNPSKINNEFDETPVEEYSVDKVEFIKKYKDLKKLNLPLTGREKVLFEIVNYLDSPYLYGGNTKSGIDCSAFISNVFNTALKFKLPRTASLQYGKGREISLLSNLVFGDLVFFDTSKSSFPGHVGIYLGNDLFAHASVSQGVTVSNIKDKYYKDRFVGARRVEKFK